MPKHNSTTTVLLLYRALYEALRSSSKAMPHSSIVILSCVVSRHGELPVVEKIAFCGGNLYARNHCCAGSTFRMYGLLCLTVREYGTGTC